MFVINFLSISGVAIYETLNILDFSPLSRFFLDVYLFELDNYVLTVSRKVSFFKSFCLKGSPDFDHIDNLKSYSSVRLNNLLKNNLKLKHIYYKQKKFIVMTSKKLNFTVLLKFVTYIRFLDFFLLGIIGSLVFASYFHKKVYNFIRSTLQFDLKSFKFFKSQGSFINFIGYTFKLSSIVDLNYFSVSKVKSYKKYFLRILQKVEFNLCIVSNRTPVGYIKYST